MCNLRNEKRAGLTHLSILQMATKGQQKQAVNNLSVNILIFQQFSSLMAFV